MKKFCNTWISDKGIVRINIKGMKSREKNSGITRTYIPTHATVRQIIELNNSFTDLIPCNRYLPIRILKNNNKKQAYHQLHTEKELALRNLLWYLLWFCSSSATVWLYIIPHWAHCVGSIFWPTSWTSHRIFNIVIFKIKIQLGAILATKK